MISIEERASQFDFIAYPTYDTLPLIYARIRALLNTGRRATLIRYYRASDPHLELHPSLTPDWHGGPLPSYLPSELVEDSDARTRYFEIGFWPGLEQLRLRGDDVPEEAVAERFILNQPSSSWRRWRQNATPTRARALETPRGREYATAAQPSPLLWGWGRIGGMTSAPRWDVRLTELVGQQ